ncbi:MAG: hypothetical protein AAF235_08785 [Planctomycetota bacterium]
MTENSAAGGRAAGGPSAANRFAVDYREEAARFGPPPCPIVDGHLHVNGARASEIFGDVMDIFGVKHLMSQSQLSEAAAVRKALGDRISFVAIPEYSSEDRGRAFREGFLENLDVWHGEYGARMVKLWNAPRWRDFARGLGGEDDLIDLDSPWRRRIADRACELGMMMMAHIADPDTWFKTKYADASLYLTKDQHYEALERMLELYPVPWLIAHMGGSPEDLGRLTGLLDRYPRVVLDTSATKWMVRELSKHPRPDLVAFLERFRGRVVFGSDIVTGDEHLRPTNADTPRFGAQLASSEADAFDLYASRYWALRTMFETDYDGESNIADPDLALVEPDRYDAMSAPRLVGRSLPRAMLLDLYSGAFDATIGAWYETGSFRDEPG